MYSVFSISSLDRPLSFRVSMLGLTISDRSPPLSSPLPSQQSVFATRPISCRCDSDRVSRHTGASLAVLLGSLHDRSLGDLDSSTGATAVALDSENALTNDLDATSLYRSHSIHGHKECTYRLSTPNRPCTQRARSINASNSPTNSPHTLTKSRTRNRRT